MIRIKQIKMPINHTKDDIKTKVAKKLKIDIKDIEKIKISKKSIDARKELNYVYEIDAKTKKEKQILKKNIKDVSRTPNEKYTLKIKGKEKLKNRPIIIGSGPAGLFAAYLLAKKGYNPVIIERGQKIEKRVKTVENFWKNGILDENTNVQFGEGGAGTFSDGKLNTSVKDKHNRKKYVLETFVKHGAPEEILYLNKPHIGTDLLRNTIINMRKEIIKHGGTFKFETCLKDITVENGKITQIKTNKETINTDILILAIGHSSRDTLEMLLKQNIIIKPKPFAIGIRIQHKQSMINKNQYKKTDKLLPPASYKLTYKSKDNRGVYSFCMCPGGFVVNSSSEKEMLCINGMSNHKRDEENANSAIIVTISPDDFGNKPLDGIKYQRKLESITYQKGKGKIPVQLLKDFLNKEKTKEIGNINPIFKGKYAFSDLNEIFPPYISKSLKEGILYFDKKIKGFASDDAILAAIESRTSSPIRIERDKNFESNIKGIYPIGEGAGYAGGIMTSAIDGIKLAELIVQKYKPIKTK